MNDQKATGTAEEFLKFLSRHVVAMVYQYESRNPDGSVYHRGAGAISGFVIEVRGHWFWTTAGHCIEDLEKLLRRADVTVSNFALMDYFGKNAPHRHVIPFPYEIGDAWREFDREYGLDYALLQLTGIVAQAVAANGIEPVGRGWEHIESLQFDAFQLVGFPSSAIQSQVEPDGYVTAGVRPLLLSIDQIDPEVAIAAGAESRNCFTGRIPNDVGPVDIEGMSGGPIIGYRRLPNGRIHYHIVAVQSGWVAPKRIILGCYLPTFLALVRHAIDTYVVSPPTDQ